MNLIYGTHDQHYQTVLRAKENGVSCIWSGDMKNDYLRENLAYAEISGWVYLKFFEDYESQMSGYYVTYLI